MFCWLTFAIVGAPLYVPVTPASERPNWRFCSAWANCWASSASVCLALVGAQQPRLGELLAQSFAWASRYSMLSCQLSRAKVGLPLIEPGQRGVLLLGGHRLLPVDRPGQAGLLVLLRPGVPGGLHRDALVALREQGLLVRPVGRPVRRRGGVGVGDGVLGATPAGVARLHVLPAGRGATDALRVIPRHLLGHASQASGPARRCRPSRISLSSASHICGGADPPRC